MPKNTKKMPQKSRAIVQSIPKNKVASSSKSKASLDNQSDKAFLSVDNQSNKVSLSVEPNQFVDLDVDNICKYYSRYISISLKNVFRHNRNKRHLYLM